MSNPTCQNCDCVDGCQSRERLCPNLADPKQTPPTITAYLARTDDGDMLFFDKTEAHRYCEYESEPEPLVLLSAIAQPEQPAQKVKNAPYEQIKKLCRLYLDDEQGRYRASAIFTQIFSAAAIAQPDQPAPVRQPLTHTEITSLAYDCNALPEVVTDKTLMDFARAIEAAIAQPKDKP